MTELFSGGLISYSIPQIVLNIVVTFVLSFVIALVYKKTHKGLSYSQSFVFTLVLMSVIVSVVMMIIGNSLARAFGLLGAFSIIRFRTAVKDTKDTGYIFFALAIGMAVGTGSYNIAVVGTILILLVILILDKINFTKDNDSSNHAGELISNNKIVFNIKMIEVINFRYFFFGRHAKRNVNLFFKLFN